MELKSTEAGYVNKKNQKNLGKTSKPGTDNNQWFYQMECLECGHKYFANGSDIWQRKCPKCQGVKHKEIKFLVAYKYVMCYNNFANVLMCITNKCIVIHI